MTGFTPSELAELAIFDAQVDDDLNWSHEEVEEARRRDKEFEADRLTPQQLRKRKHNRDYYERNKARINARNAAYAAAHREQIKAYRDRYYAENTKSICERRKAHDEATAEARAEYQRKYYQLHKAEHNAYSRQYRADHLEKERERNKRWRETHQAEIKAYRIANRERDNAKARERYARKKAMQCGQNAEH